MPQALLVDDDVPFVLGLAEAVKREGFRVSTAGSLKEAREELSRTEPDALFVDMQLPDGSGLELVQPTNGRLPQGVVFITGHANLELAVEALRLGVSDFLVKPIDLARVKMALGNLSKSRELTRQVGALRGELRRLGRFGSLIGAASRMQEVYDLLAKVAPTDASVLVLGKPAPARSSWRGPSTR